jgi:membrane-associated phospholipid phosphatase
MNSVIAWSANYLLWVMAAAAAIYWLVREPRAGKITLAASAVVGLVLTFLFIAVAAKLHADPRPFAQNPRVRPLIAHSADNGFPSDHAAAAGLLAMLILFRHRPFGVLLSIAAILVAASRVAAHVHHLQDVVAGLALGAAAAITATVLVNLAIDRLTPTVHEPSAVREH